MTAAASNDILGTVGVGKGVKEKDWVDVVVASC